MMLARMYVDENDEPQLIESEYDHLSISMPTRIWNAIDSLRGDVPRSTFMRRILERSKVISDYLRRQEEEEEVNKERRQVVDGSIKQDGTNKHLRDIQSSFEDKTRLP